MTKSYKYNTKVMKIKKTSDKEKIKTNNTKNKLPLLSGLLKENKISVEKKTLIDYIKRYNLVTFANELLKLYSKEKDEYIRGEILSILKNWFETKKLNKIPKALIEGIKENKTDYYDIFYFLADCSPKLFADRIVKLLCDDNIDINKKISFHIILEKLVKKHEIELNYSYFSKKILKTTELIVLTKKDLEWKNFFIDGVLEQKLRAAYVDATITADLFKYYTIPKEEYARINFLVTTLSEIKFFAPAADIVINSKIAENEKIPLLLMLHHCIGSIENIDTTKMEKLEEIRKKIYYYLEKMGVVPFFPYINQKS